MDMTLSIMGTDDGSKCGVYRIYAEMFISHRFLGLAVFAIYEESCFSCIILEI
jgi:hypothetical protein